MNAEAEGDPEVEPTSAIYALLRSRASKQQAIAVSTLGAIVAILIGGTAMFWLAGRVEFSYDTGPIDPNTGQYERVLDDLQDEVVKMSLVSSAFVRLGIVTMLVFLVQFLVGVYRHAQRLATFYNARADVLMTDQLSLTDLAADRVGFGPDPKTPIEQAVELVREVVKASPAEKK